MTTGVAGMLIGLFVVPIVLLWLGHRLRRRTERQWGAFWGMLFGYGIGACAALVVSMWPAEMWTADDAMRGLFGFWSLLVAPAVGALLGAASGSRAPHRRP